MLSAISADPSYVFFREIPDGPEGPIGALGVPLTAGRSVAVDPRTTPLGYPVFVSTSQPGRKGKLNRLVMAQDTGGAIRGAVRADYFWGFGADAYAQAARMKESGRMWLMLDRHSSANGKNYSRSPRATRPPAPAVSVPARRPPNAWSPTPICASRIAEHRCPASRTGWTFQPCQPGKAHGYLLVAWHACRSPFHAACGSVRSSFCNAPAQKAKPGAGRAAHRSTPCADGLRGRLGPRCGLELRWPLPVPESEPVHVDAWSSAASASTYSI
jgi:3D (Asp-Asp-Asp) domain-containing protein